MTHPSDEESTTLASSPPNPNLVTMPTEILLEIIEATERGSLLAFARCTKRLNSLITPYIYQSIHYVDTEHKPYEEARYPDWGSTPPNTPPKNCRNFVSVSRADTRIYDIAGFLRTISSSQKLRSAIGAASFVWNDAINSGSSISYDVKRITGLLNQENCQLHMALLAPDLSWSHYNWPKSLRSLELTAMTVQSVHGSASEIQFQFTARKLYEIFCHRNLQQITLKDIYDWDMMYVPIDKYPPRMSGVKCMQLLHTVLHTNMPIDETSSIFTWPSALYSFRHHFWYPTRKTPLNPSLWVKILNGHQKSLKELFISISTPNRGRDALGGNGPSMGSGLRAFENINILGVPWVFLIEKHFFTYVDSHQILPPMLEVLQVQLPDDYEWNPFLERSKELKPRLRLDFETVDVAPLELRNWLTQIAQHKSSHYPLLKEFTVWQKHPYPLQKEEPCSEIVWTHNLEGVEAFDEPKSVCLLADINLSWITSDYPPHFCASPHRQR